MNKPYKTANILDNTTQKNNSELTVGDQAPLFEAKDQNGNIFKLQDCLGNKLVLYFYPKDDTETCTKQACNLRDNYEALLSKGYTVIGVSTDDETSHQKFIKKYTLPFTLITDPDLKIVKLYGVWKEKTMFGNKFMGTVRTTFVTDEAGTIRHIIKKVKSASHSEQILDLGK